MIFKTKHLQLVLVLKIRMYNSFIAERNRIHYLCNKDIWVPSTHVTHLKLDLLDVIPGLNATMDGRAKRNLDVCKDT